MVAVSLTCFFYGELTLKAQNDGIKFLFDGQIFFFGIWFLTMRDFEVFS